MTPRCHIVPPYLLRKLSQSEDPEISARARRTLRSDTRFRSDRLGAEAGLGAPALQSTSPAAARQLWDARGTERLPGTLIRRGDDPATGDPAADEAWDGFGATWRLLFEAFGRNSIDGSGMTLDGTVHYGRGYDNAFWDGERMVFGDGDGEIFGRFTASLEVIGHELAHGVTELTAGLIYSGQPGALNEHMSDVLGVLVKQRTLGLRAEESDWLVGADLLLPGVAGVALRNMLHPGTAYDDPRLGADPQPAHFSDFVLTRDDNGGVHINSGIPNRAFALAALAVGGDAWSGVGQVWFDVLTGEGIRARTDFRGFARLTVAAARARFGPDSAHAEAIADAWRTVGIAPIVQAPSASDAPDAPDVPAAAEADLLLRRTGGLLDW
ncbi:MAG: M4 family metallopeptidase [Micropruina sp.]|nr:M4 family metallopeptidase [Micropruina sp.]